MPLLRQANAEPIPGYRLIEPLGSGGFGEVWKCEAPGGLFKAVKFVNGNLDTDDVEGVFAEQELNALQRVKAIRHPFILSMERVETIDGELLIVMELADKSLHDRLQECKGAGLLGIPRDELLCYLKDAAEALDLMNEKYDLQHLDIKPRNLFLVSNHVKVADFGLVKDLEERSSGGGNGRMGGVTPLYAAPETFKGIISRHSDQYSLAIVYQELMSGSPPFDGTNARHLALQHAKEAPDLRSLPATDRPIVAKALAKEPRERFPSCTAFVRALVSGQLPDAGGAATARTPLAGTDSWEDLYLSPIEADKVFKSGVTPLAVPLQPGIAVTQPGRGSLRPTLVVGVGEFGWRAMQALRHRIIDRFESLDKLPLLRFLYIDTDAKALKSAQQGHPEQALAQSETHHLPLQPIAYYRRNRKVLDLLTEWLPMEKLYALPRSLETQGSRALARLALCDNYLRLAARLKRELQVLTQPSVLDVSVSQSGLALRNEIPQVHILASAGGGTGSGTLIDLAYTVRRLMHDMNLPDSDVLAFLLAGAPNDPAIPVEEQANLYATLTEVNHYSDPGVTFASQYGVEGPVLRDDGPPFRAVYLMRLDYRSPERVQHAAAHIASYVFHELSTPMGLRLAASRLAQSSSAETPFRSFGTHTVWFPRGLLLRVAAQRACQSLLDQFTQKSAPTAEDGQLLEEVFSDPCWQEQELQQRFEGEAGATTEGPPGAALTAFLATLEPQIDQALARDDPAGWCRQAVDRVREWVGSGVSVREETSEWRKSRLHRAFAAGIQKVADEYSELLAKSAHNLVDQPGRRLAAAEAALEYFQRACAERSKEQDNRIRESLRRTEQAWQEVEHSIQACLTGSYGSFRFFAGNRVRKLLRAFLDKLSGYARQRLAEESVRSVQHFYVALQGRLQDLQRDLSFCRQRLRHLHESLVNPPQEDEWTDPELHPELLLAAPPSTSQLLKEAVAGQASRLVLPEGAEDLNTAANQFLERLAPEQWSELDAWLQEHVLTPMGGMHQACISSSDLERTLKGPLIKGATEYLSQQLPVTDVCQVELSEAETLGIDLAAQAKAYFALAEPSVRSKQAGRELGYLLVSNTDPGKVIAEAAKKAIPDLNIVRIPHQSDLLFCREQTHLNLTDLQRMVERCKSAYQQLSSVPASSPHSRSDILDWIPLDP